MLPKCQLVSSPNKTEPAFGPDFYRNVVCNIPQSMTQCFQPLTNDVQPESYPPYINSIIPSRRTAADG
jgi:hypothetical protein